MIDPAGTGSAIVPTAMVGLNNQASENPSIALLENLQFAGILFRTAILPTSNAMPDTNQY